MLNIVLNILVRTDHFLNNFLVNSALLSISYSIFSPSPDMSLSSVFYLAISKHFFHVTLV